METQIRDPRTGYAKVNNFASGGPVPALAKGATGMEPPVLSTYAKDRALTNYEQAQLLKKALKK